MQLVCDWAAAGLAVYCLRRDPLLPKLVLLRTHTGLGADRDPQWCTVERVGLSNEDVHWSRVLAQPARGFLQLVCAHGQPLSKLSIDLPETGI